LGEEFLLAIAERSVLSAGFLYLLYYLIRNMNIVTNNLATFGITLGKVSEILLKIDTKLDIRMEQLEKRVTCLEDKS